jgi:hypothetical protein
MVADDRRARRPDERSYLPEIAAVVDYLRVKPSIAAAFVYAGDVEPSTLAHEAFSVVASDLFPSRTTACDVLSATLSKRHGTRPRDGRNKTGRKSTTSNVAGCTQLLLR